MKVKHDYSYMGNGEELIKKGYAELDIHSINFTGNYDSLIKIYNYIKNTKYTIYNITDGLSYTDDYDLYFYSNKGWNNKDIFDFFQLNPNDDREADANKILINGLLEDIKNKFSNFDDVQCRIQYTTRVNDELLQAKSTEIKKKLVDQTIEYQGMKGKIKPLKGQDDYGFFKLRAKTKYYPISSEYLVLNFE